MTMLIYRTPQMGAVEDSIWATTGDLDTESRSLEIAVKQMGRDIFEDNSISASSDAYQVFLRSWNAFVADFNQWLGAPWFWNPARRDQLLAHRARFNSMLSQFKAFGGMTGAVPTQDKAGPGPLDKAGELATKLVWVVGIGAAIWVGATVYKEMRGR